MQTSTCHRNCPLCHSDAPKGLFKVTAKSFSNNVTLIQSELDKLGLPQEMEFSRCENCSMIYLADILNAQTAEAYYHNCIDAEASKRKIYRNAKRRRYAGLSHQLLMNALNTIDGEILVFEYGCGWGDFLSRIHGDGVKVVGLEYDQRKANFCKEKGIHVVDQLNDLNDIHIFFSNQVFEHMPSPFELLQQIKPRLHSKFTGYISVPFYEPETIKDIEARLKSGEAVTDKNLNPYEHINLFSHDTLRQLLLNCGFQTVDTLPHGISFRFTQEILI
jgi:hypothetical protein